MNRRTRKPILAALLVLAVVGLGGALALTDWRTVWEGAREVFTSPEALREFVAGSRVWAPAVFFGVMVAQVVLTPIPSAPVTLAGAIAFGVWGGFALSLAGSVVGSVLAFLAVRRWGEPLVARLVGEGTYRRYAGKPDDKGWWLFAVLLLPFAPDDAAVSLAGLSTLPFRRFFAMMVLGRIPATALTVLLASGAVAGSTATVVTAGLAVVALLSLGFVYRGRLEGWASRSTGDERTSVDPTEAPTEVSRAGDTRQAVDAR